MLSIHRIERSRRGFTLIELLLVLVILGVLAAIVVPKFTKRTEDAKKTAAASQIANVATAIRLFEVDVGRYPTSDEGLRALFEQPGNAKDWKGPYMEQKVTNDPWGNPYVYKQPGAHNTSGYDIYSFGPDGAEGGGDDIGNWKDEK
jgi:general secretion pathway protein G